MVLSWGGSMAVSMKTRKAVTWSWQVPIHVWQEEQCFVIKLGPTTDSQDAILLDDSLPRNRHGNDFLVTSNLQAYALQDQIFSYRTIWPILRFFENCSYTSELVLRFLRTVVIYQNWFFKTWILLGSLIHPATAELSIIPLLWPFTLHPNPHKKAIVWCIKHSVAAIPFCKTPMSGFPCMAGSPTSIVDSVIPFV